MDIIFNPVLPEVRAFSALEAGTVFILRTVRTGKPIVCMKVSGGSRSDSVRLDTGELVPVDQTVPVEEATAELRVEIYPPLSPS
jgi:hypothetical protein